MSEGTIVFIVAIAAFLVLALIVAFRFKSVKNTFEGLGFKISVEGDGKREEHNPEGAADGQSVLSPAAPKEGGNARISIGGRVEKSSLTASGERDGQVNIGKDVIDSTVQARGGQSAGVDVDGHARGSTINAENPE